MTPTGSTAEWVDLLDPLVPDILTLVIQAWESMKPPAANAREDPVTVDLCRALRRSRDLCELPFRVDTQLVELEPADGEDQGRMDLVFSPDGAREDKYFCLECKRINVRSPEGVRPYFAEYVKLGMMRFIRGQYSRSARSGGMLAFVLDGDVAGALAGVERNIKDSHRDLGMHAPASFQMSRFRPTDDRARETHHDRDRALGPFVIHHLFMAGDAAAPVLPEPSGPSASAGTRKKRKTVRQSVRR